MTPELTALSRERDKLAKARQFVTDKAPAPEVQHTLQAQLRQQEPKPTWWDKLRKFFG